MTRNWEPGDVAMVECSDGEWRQAQFENLLSDAPRGWRFSDGLVRRPDCNARSLVVIDPEDREQVERLRDALPMEFAWNAVQRTLRSLIAPPKPDEPLGLGAIVEDADGENWVRALKQGVNVSDDWLRMGGLPDAKWTFYNDITAVRVLSEGVS